MQSHKLVLDDGSEILADALLCGTGWDSRYPFFSMEQVCSLGLPHPPEEDSAEEAELWESLLKSADDRVLSEFPILQNPPLHKTLEISTTTLRLYNCIAPLEDDSVVFLGRPQVSNYFRTAEAQAIWTTAYFDRNVLLSPTKNAKEQVAYMNAFSKRRYPSYGTAGDCLYYELIWYTDKLLDEVGLKSHRKNWWSDLVDPCLTADLKDMADEYEAKYTM